MGMWGLAGNAEGASEKDGKQKGEKVLFHRRSTLVGLDKLIIKLREGSCQQEWTQK